MQIAELKRGGLLLLGCGKMGSALLGGWMARGLRPDAAVVIEPKPSRWLLEQDISLNPPDPGQPEVCVLAVKPQSVSYALPRLVPLGGGRTVFVSIIAGTRIAAFESILGEGTPVIRAMPNTPAAIGMGITALTRNANVCDRQLELGENLLRAVGETVRLDEEGQLDAVTAVSGSGPAYVFLLVETLAAAGEAEGLPADLAMQLALETVAGAGCLARQRSAPPDVLRQRVTSPAGTTEAALSVLMDKDQGLAKLMRAAVRAATARSIELGKDG